MLNGQEKARFGGFFVASRKVMDGLTLSFRCVNMEVLTVRRKKMPRFTGHFLFVF